MKLFWSSDGCEFHKLIKYPEICINANEFTFITGKSGCGKTSYLSLLNKCSMPTDGVIEFKGQDIANADPIKHRKQVLQAVQEVFLIEDSILENFKFYYNAREESLINTSEMSRFLNILEADFSLDTHTSKLSGGEKQRVFLAIFLSLASEVLLLDEPTAALDEETSEQIIKNIMTYTQQNNISTICVCHNEKIVEKFALATIRLDG